MPDIVFLNGSLLPADEARISVFDAGLTHGAGLFETLRAYRGRVFRVRDHLDRLLRSAAMLELRVPVSMETLERAVNDTLAANQLAEARVRMVVTPGDVPRPGRDVTDGPTPTILVTVSAARLHPAQDYQRGWRVCISPYKTSRFDPTAGHKTLAYLARMLAMKDAASRGCAESLWFTTDNLLAEGSICNVFIVSDGAVLTPPTSTPVLAGVTRKSVIELAAANRIVVEEKAIDINMLLAAEEVFLTGSVLEIMPVTAIEKHVVGAGQPGPVTKQLMELYQELVKRECGE